MMARLSLRRAAPSHERRRNLLVLSRAERGHDAIAGDGDSRIFGKVYNVERLGGDTFIYLNGPDGAGITVHAPGDMMVAHGDEVTVGFSGDKCHLFHANGEAFQRLRA